MFNMTLPLLGNLPLDYDECCAKIILETLFSGEFSNLKIDCESPDLQNEILNVGIEVTNSDNQSQREAESLYTKLEYKVSKNQKRDIERIEQLGAKYNDGILIGIPGHDNFSEILSGFKIKLEKLNSPKFKVFQDNHLFIYSSIYATSDMIIAAMEEMNQYQNAKDYKFNKVFIAVPYYIYVCDLIENSFEIVDIHEKQIDFALKAREMVERAIKN